MWIIVRLCGIVIGIATLLRVATNEKLVTYDPLFLAWMDWLSDIVELGFLTKLIGPFLHWGIEWVRSLGVSVPDLQDEWRPAFVLSTLMFGALVRHGDGDGDGEGVGLRALVLAPFALSVVVWSGLTGSLTPVAFVAVVGCMGFAESDDDVGMGVITVWIVAFFGVAAAAIFGVAAAAIVAAAAVLIVFAGGMQSWAGGWRALFANSAFNIGIDILFTMAFAFVIAVAAANPPIW